MEAKLKTIKVKVTKEHINKGVAGSCGKCPIALAMLDAGFQGASVYPEEVAALTRTGTRRHPLILSASDAQKVETFVDLFDVGSKVRPMTLAVKASPEVLKRVKFAGQEAR